MARTIEDESYQVQALTGLISHLPDGLREMTLQETLAAAQAIKNKWSEVKLTTLIPQMIELPSTKLLSMWPVLLQVSARSGRESLLSEIRKLTPMIAKLGGDEAIVELFHAIQDVGRW
ncbi:MAG: hypothetical protein GY801_10175 [bacterium]|nr:hypothetical protein [bacterium]